ncbi:CHAT domain-containing protein [Aquimarina sp. ERC-38]|uniref:CHAT domain-containing protein n=1 Tax=Aquimarina sp. ERC-38 TaxID=2949996 RepID=UPI002247B3CC|nr:CHAT domain-containing tetratricopeptide repeat protein [Aquimarina sp. ERC-38]UZO82574.1 CHAT domain-containing protein [Aquimarina sp. ERC-38]
MKQKKAFLFLSLVCMICTTLFANKKPTIDTLSAYEFYKHAEDFKNNYRYLEAINFYKKAQEEYQSVTYWEGVARCYNKISKTYRNNADYEYSYKFAKKALKVCNKFLKKSSEKIKAFHNIGKYYDSNLDIKEALSYYKKALYLVDVHQCEFNKSYILQSISSCHLNFNNIEFALAYAKDAVKKAENSKIMDRYVIPNAYTYLTHIYKKTKKFNEAEKNLFKSLKHNKKNNNLRNEALNYTDLADIYRETGQYHLGISMYEKAIKIFRQINLSKHIYMANFFDGLGIAYKEMNNLDQAIMYYFKSLNIMSSKYGESSIRSTYILNNLGDIYDQKKDFKKAFYFYNKAIRIIKYKVGTNNLRYARLINNKAYTLIQVESYKKALELTDQSFSIRKKLFGSSSLYFAYCYKNYGHIYKGLGNHTKAMLYFKKELKTLNRYYGPSHPETLEAINNIASMYHQNKDYTKALEYYTKAVEDNANPSNSNYKAEVAPFYPHAAIASYRGLANTYTAMFNDHCNTKYLKLAQDAFVRSDQILKELNKTSTTYQDKLEQADQIKEVYAGALSVEGLTNHSDPNYCFYLTERSKAMFLREALADNELKNLGLIPDSIQQKEKETKVNLAFYKSELVSLESSTDKDTSKIQEVNSAIFSLRRSQDSLTNLIKEKFPEYFNLKHNPKVVSVPQLQTKLDDKTSVLQFFTYQEKVYAFLVDNNNIYQYTYQLPDLEKDITTLNQSVVSKNNSEYKKYATRLYQQLIMPFEHKIKARNLIIIPDGVLWQLNFDLLLTQNTNSNNPKNFSYLAHKYAISYANSATSWYQGQVITKNKVKQTGKYRTKDCLAFSFSDSIQTKSRQQISLTALRDAKVDLPGTRKEIKAISSIVDGDYFYGNEAAETNFKKNADKYKILHLALHGEVNHQNPENSKLLFTKTKDSIEDNQLYMHELFALKIPAELAVLSACNTGSGKINKGEGVMSLGKAFQYAGTKSLLLSNWEISDKTTPELMRLFYSNLKKGMNKAQALQKAKLTFLNSSKPQFASPFYWAGFYIVGNTDPIEFTKANTTLSISNILLIILLLLIILILFYYLKSLGIRKPIQT